MNREQIGADAWNCETWPDWLHDIVAETNEVADRLDMSAEQAHAYAILAALAAIAAPKAEAVDPSAWQRRKLYDANGRIPQWEFCPASEATGHFEKVPGYEYRPLYTSPVPALTDEAVERAARMALMYLETGFMACDRCGHEMETKTTDACHELRTAFPSKG